MARLVVRKGSIRERFVYLDRAETILGRDPDHCQVLLRDDAVSRRHARIGRDADGYTIEDQGSRNKTYLNGRVVTGARRLKSGDEVRVCDFVFVFESGIESVHEGSDLRPQELTDAAAADTRPFDIRARLPAGPDADSPGPLADARAMPILDVCRAAAKFSLRPPELISRIVELIGPLFPAAGQGLVLMGAPADPSRLIVEARFARRPEAEAIDHHPAIAAEALRTARGILAADGPIGERSVLCAPVVAPDGTPYGAVWVDATRPFGEPDLYLLVWLAAMLGTALGTARDHVAAVDKAMRAGDNETARKIQRNLLPQKLPAVAGYTFHSYYEPAQMVGGDYYDFVPLPDGRLAVMVADVAGKGVPAALLMSRLSAEARACILADPDDIAAAVGKLNANMAGLMLDRFITLAVAVLDPAAHTATVLCAGHEPPKLIRPDSDAITDALPVESIGLALGLATDSDYTANDIKLEPGDSLVLFTDGVTDALNPAESRFGLEGLRNTITHDLVLPLQLLRPHELAQRIIRDVKQHTAGRSQNDDITLVCFGRDGDDAGDPALSTRHVPPPRR